MKGVFEIMIKFMNNYMVIDQKRLDENFDKLKSKIEGFIEKILN